MSPSELADLIAAAAADKKAREVVTLDLRGKTTIADFFVICEGDTDRQVRAIVDNIEAVARQSGARPLNVAGLRAASWAWLDFDSMIAHVFLSVVRAFYDIVSTWGRRAGKHSPVARPATL